ncbi:hypothetical protein ACS127_12720 [Amphibacillus sp. Q70]|uniref:hypothetical protein n=1 Tax=Amphibacillus sp. Q70 TaxID=3453416 RepID=UPI003F828C9F
MSVTIKRKIGWAGSGSRAVIKLNGEKVAKVSENQLVKIDIPNNDAKLKVSLMGMKSNEFEVRDGDIIEITPTKWYRNMSKAVLILGPLLGFIYILSPSIWKVFVIICWIAFLISLFLIDGFHLTVLGDNS